MTTITIELGNGSNPEETIPGTNKVKFKNTTTTAITLTTPQGLNPQGQTNIAAGATETQNGFTISANPGAVLTYGWDDENSRKRDARSGTIRIS